MIKNKKIVILSVVSLLPLLLALGFFAYWSLTNKIITNAVNVVLADYEARLDYDKAKITGFPTKRQFEIKDLKITDIKDESSPVFVKLSGIKISSEIFSNKIIIDEIGSISLGGDELMKSISLKLNKDAKIVINYQDNKNYQSEFSYSGFAVNDGRSDIFVYNAKNNISKNDVSDLKAKYLVTNSGSNVSFNGLELYNSSKEKLSFDRSYDINNKLAKFGFKFNVDNYQYDPGFLRLMLPTMFDLKKSDKDNNFAMDLALEIKSDVKDEELFSDKNIEKIILSKGQGVFDYKMKLQDISFNNAKYGYKISGIIKGSKTDLLSNLNLKIKLQQVQNIKEMLIKQIEASSLAKKKQEEEMAKFRASLQQNNDLATINALDQLNEAEGKEVTNQEKSDSQKLLELFDVIDFIASNNPNYDQDNFEFDVNFDLATKSFNINNVLFDEIMIMIKKIDEPKNNLEVKSNVEIVEEPVKVQ